MKVTVVILNWNGKKILEKFLPSVVNHTLPYASIVVADNASTDDSIDFVNKNYPLVKIIRNSINEGFAKGYNSVLKQIDSEYYILLNSDVEVTANWIEPIIAMMDNDSRIAAVQPKIKSFHDKAFFEYAGAAGGFIDKFSYPFCRGRILNFFEKDDGQYDDRKEIFWATGACLFIKADIFHKVGRFDEDFFAHMEEIDLCWRIKNLGYKIMYCPESTVFHLGGGTLSKANSQKTFLNFRNNLILFCKNHTPQYFLIKLLLRFLLDGIAAFKFLFSGEPNHFFAVLKAHFYFYSSLKKTLVKRANLKKQISSYTKTGIYKRSIAFDYFIRGKRKFSELNPLLFD